MRCPSCNRFVGLDTDVDPEENSQEIDGTIFKATYRRVLQCIECGDDMKEASLDVEYDFGANINEGLAADLSKLAKSALLAKDKVGENAVNPDYLRGFYQGQSEAFDAAAKLLIGKATGTHEHKFEIVACDVVATTKSLKKRTHYGVSCTVEVTCFVDDCNAMATFECAESEPASSFEEMT